MTVVECLIAVQTSGTQIRVSNAPGTPYFLIGLLAVVMGLVVWIFIRTSAGRSPKRRQTASGSPSQMNYQKKKAL